MLASIVLVASLSSSVQEGEALRWWTDYDAALAHAATEKKAVIASFTGSDWCHWCKRLQTEVFGDSAFEEWARDQVVLVRLDFPRRTTLSAKQRRRNTALARAHDVTSYPTLIFLDAEGQAFDRMGYVKGGAAEWLRVAERKLAGVADAKLHTWFTDFDAAVAMAKRTGRPLLLDFTGSDWCAPCARLKKDVFDTPTFREWSANELVLVELDFPRRSKLPEGLAAQNRQLQAKYQVRSFPTVLILDAEGTLHGRLGYEPGPDPFIAKIVPMVRAAKGEETP